jgi:GSH-dependent disulfide-bond oxidoreductase
VQPSRADRDERRQQQNLHECPNLRRWFEAVRDRPATVRAYEIAGRHSKTDVTSEESRKVLFGQTAQVFKRHQR